MTRQKHPARYGYLILTLPLLLAACTFSPAPPATARPAPGQPASATPPPAAPTRPTARPTSRPPTPTPLARPTPKPTATSIPLSPAPTTPPEGGQITVGGLGAPASLNPYLDGSDIAQALTPLLFDSLLAVEPDSGQLTPRLARSFDVSEDARTITFELAAGVRWHDGQPLTARDVLFTWQAMIDADRFHRFWIPPERIDGLAAPDPATITVSLTQPDCSLLYELGQAPILPRHILEATGLFDEGFGRAPVGSGPFVFANWSETEGIQLARNESAWQAAPFLEGWTYRPFSDTLEMKQALAAGLIDAALLPPGQGADEDGFSTYAVPQAEMFFIAFNLEHPLLGEDKVRRALGHALDREQILAEALGGEGVLLAGSLGPGHWAGDSSLAWPDYDPDLAGALLAGAGLVDTDGDGWLEQEGQTVEIALRTNAGNDLRRSIAILAGQYWRAVGLKTNVELVSWPSVVDDIFTRDYDAVVFSWPLEPDPDQSRFWRSTDLNIVSFADEAVDGWLQAGLSTPGCAAEGRAALYSRVQQRLAELRPYDFLLLPQATLLAGPNLNGPAPGLWAGPFWNAGKWFLER
ncbi:MAG: ABC transporter substrate-binding protein [Anaerolineae bacterium]